MGVSSQLEERKVCTRLRCITRKMQLLLVFFLAFLSAGHGAGLVAAEEGLPGPSGCCDWPSCFDERTQLCLDTCLNTWTQCPGKLFLMTCYSPYMSPYGELPLECFPDAVPHLAEAQERGLTGSPKEVREMLHKMNMKSCHIRTGICRPVDA